MAYSYNDFYAEARKKTLVDRLKMREINGDIDKLKTAVSLNRVFCIVEPSSHSSYGKLNNDNRKCPYLYEAEAVEFATSLQRQSYQIKRCITCTRALHAILDNKKIKCSFCI